MQLWHWSWPGSLGSCSPPMYNQYKQGILSLCPRTQERACLAARRLETPTLYYGNLHSLRVPQVRPGGRKLGRASCSSACSAP